MDAQRRSINHVLVRLFNDILNIEERALAQGDFSDASVKEMHTLEAVANAKEENSMSAVAARLGITIGSLTVAVSTLVRKGYLTRQRADKDRRVVRLQLTEKGERANAHHMRFHTQMVDQVQKLLNAQQLTQLVETLDIITGFFENYEQNTLQD